MMQFTHSLEPRGWILGSLVAVVFLALSYGLARGRSRPWVRTLCGFLRLVAIVGLVLCLLEPQWVEKAVHPRRARLAVLVDTSRSMATTDVPGSRLAAARAWIDRHVSAAKPDSVDLLPLRFSDSLLPDTNGVTAAADGPSTGLSRALESLLALPPEAPLTGVLLVSDGIETEGLDPEAAARRLRRHEIGRAHV